MNSDYLRLIRSDNGSLKSLQRRKKLQREREKCEKMRKIYEKISDGNRKMKILGFISLVTVCSALTGKPIFPHKMS